MGKHARPTRVYDFAGHAARTPNAPPPGDRLNAQFAEHADAIVKIQLALEQIDKPLTADRLDPKFIKHIVAEAKQSLEQLASDSARAAGRAASAAQHAANAAAQAQTVGAPVLARAEALLAEEREALARLEAQARTIRFLERKLEDLENRPALREPTDPIGVLGPNAGGKHSADTKGATATAADYADVATHWAEWMGPGGLGTGGASGASDVIPANILAINAISGDHWSSRWWAHRAAAAVGGQLAYLYLGPYPSPPLTTPDGGQIPIGAIYYNTSNDSMYVWNGTSWLPFNSPTKAATSSLFYNASANQTVFNLGNADLFGSSHILDPLGSEGTEVYFNGVRLTPVQDYAVDPIANTITLVNPAPAGSIVGIDVMTDPKLLSPILALTAKLLPLAFDGTTTTFPLQGALGVVVVPIADASALFVVIDGVEQEPGVDFTLNAAGDSIIFAEAPAADAKSFIIAFLRSGLGFLTRVEHDNTLTGDGTTILPLGVVNATANPAQRGAIYVPGLAGAVPNALTINALSGELGMTVVVQTQVQAGTDNVQPLTSLALRNVNGLPVSSLTTVAKTVVPAINELRAGQLYKGPWQVAANTPNLTPPLVPPAAVGWTWTAQTANPNVPETAPAGLTGIAGLSIRSGDEIVWTGAAYQDITASTVLRVGDTMTGPLVLPAAAPTLATQATNKAYVDAADALLELEKVNRAGDTMTGELHLPIGPPSANDVATNKLYVDTAIASNALYRGPWQVGPNNPDLVAAVATNLNGWSWIAETVDPLVPEFAPAGMPGIGGQQVDTGDRVVFSSVGPTYQLIKGSSLSIVEGDARYLNTAGDTATGPLILAANPVAPLEAATKQYTDAADNLRVLKAGDTMTGPLVVPGPPTLAGQAANKAYVDAADALNVKKTGDTMTGQLTLPASAPVGVNDAVTKAYSDLKVLKAGDTMTGQLLLVDPPVGLTAATSKNYVDTADALRVLKAGDTMTGPLVLPAAAPTLANQATNKAYVDAAIASGNLYQGQWQVAANIPNLTPPTTPPSLNGYSWIAQTVDPNTPELAPAGLPGIGGQTIFNGDTIRWNSGTSLYERYQGSSLTIAQGDARYVEMTGDTMTGYLILNADPAVAAGAATKNYVDVLTGNRVLKSGDTMTGMLTLPIAAPTLPAEAANKQYVDVTVATNSLYQGIYTVLTNVPDLRIPPMAPLNGYSWVTQTTDPLVPDNTTVALPGIPLGTSLDSGWTIRYNGGTLLYEVIKGPNISLTTAATQFVDVTGDTMTGGLAFNGTNIGVTFTGGSGIYSWTDKALTLRCGATPLNTQPRIIDNNGARARDIIDTLNGGNYFVPKAGGTMTGGLLFGSSTSSGPNDTSRHITLYGSGTGNTTYGFAVTGSTLNYNVSSAANHTFWGGGVQYANIGPTITFNSVVNGLTSNNTINVNMGSSANGITLRKPDRTVNDYTPCIHFKDTYNYPAGNTGTLAFIRTKQTNASIYNGGDGGNLEFWVNDGLWGINYRSMMLDAHNLFVESDVYARGVMLTSDVTTKQDIAPLARAVTDTAFAALRPVSFRRKPRTVDNPLAVDGKAPLPNSDLTIHWGFIADEIEAGSSDLIREKEGEKSFDVSGLLAVMVAKIQALEEEIKLLRAERKH